MIFYRIFIGLAVLTSSGVIASEVGDIPAYIEYSPTFSSSGQPSAEQFAELRKNGFERVVYIAYSDNDKSLHGEDRIVEELGMDYLQVPVDWSTPAKGDFYLYAGAMQQEPDKKTLLHCQANYRASTFAFLYRVLYQDVPVATAKRDLDQIWRPNKAWRQLIFDVLEDNGKSPHCDGCDWSE